MTCQTICRRWLAAAMLFAMAGAANAAPLSVVEASFPAVNCLFSTTCTIVVDDTSGDIAMPFLASAGTAWLQSRTFAGKPGTPAAGLTGYMYRISLTQASGEGDCLIGFVINFGTIAKLAYAAGAPPADLFVGSQGGGLGTIGLASAEQDGGVITFWLKSPLCVPNTPSSDATTFFIGLASKLGPVPVNAGVFAYGTPSFYSVPARAPGLAPPSGLTVQP